MVARITILAALLSAAGAFSPARAPCGGAARRACVRLSDADDELPESFDFDNMGLLKCARGCRENGSAHARAACAVGAR